MEITETNMTRAYNKIIKCIESSISNAHCDSCMKMINNFISLYGIKYQKNSYHLIKLLKEKYTLFK